MKKAHSPAIDVLDWEAARTCAEPLRMQVFVVEQGVPAQLEIDGDDRSARHALAYADDGQVIATGRLRPDGRIGRMAVDASWRGRGVGTAVLRALLAEACHAGMTSAVLHAQLQAVPFYAREGFVVEGEEFMEAGIAHRLMRCTLPAAVADDG